MSLKALFLGYGRMGAALGETWFEANLVHSIDAVDPQCSRDVKAKVFRTAEELPDTSYDVVVVAVKPALASEALAALAHDRLAKATIISVMAGVSIDTLQQVLPFKRPVGKQSINHALARGVRADARRTAYAPPSSRFQGSSAS